MASRRRGSRDTCAWMLGCHPDDVAVGACGCSRFVGTTLPCEGVERIMREDHVVHWHRAAVEGVASSVLCIGIPTPC